MQGIYLKLYVSESQKHGGMVLYEWLLEQAKKMGIHGGSAFRAIAGFGRHGVLHEEGFFELAGDLPVEVGFVVSEADAGRLLGLLEAEHLQLFYVKIPAHYGVTGS
jgi:PII-like signaling protein